MVKATVFVIPIWAGIFFGYIGVAWLSAFINAWWYAPVIDTIDPSRLQWYHYFGNSDSSIDMMYSSAIFVYHFNAWMTTTLVMAGITATIIIMMILTKAR